MVSRNYSKSHPQNLNNLHRSHFYQYYEHKYSYIWFPDNQKLVQHNPNPRITFSFAAGRGDLRLIKFLLRHGAKYYPGDSSPLTGAIWNGKLDLVKYLIENIPEAKAEIPKIIVPPEYPEISNYIKNVV